MPAAEIDLRIPFPVGGWTSFCLTAISADTPVSVPAIKPVKRHKSKKMARDANSGC